MLKDETMQLVTVDMPDHDVLRQRAKEVIFPLDFATVDFIEEFYKFFTESLESPLSKPAGLAAPQVGVPLRIIILQIPPEAKKLRKDVYDELPPTIFINPNYVPASEKKSKDWEACYSVPGKMGEVFRYDEIHYEALTPFGEKISGTARGFLARSIQHETGHLDGELYLDLLEPECRYGVFEEMFEIRMRERAQIIS